MIIVSEGLDLKFSILINYNKLKEKSHQLKCAGGFVFILEITIILEIVLRIRISTAQKIQF